MTLFRPLFNEPQIGDTLLYKLRAEDLPKDPAKIWHGVVKLILVDILDRTQPRYYIVQSLEHPGCEELVYPVQYIGYQPKPLL